jgi:hypothetical protein
MQGKQARGPKTGTRAAAYKTFPLSVVIYGGVQQSAQANVKRDFLFFQ